MARELVPGDVVLVKSGDRIPADCRLVQAADLFVDESRCDESCSKCHLVLSDSTNTRRLGPSANSRESSVYHEARLSSQRCHQRTEVPWVCPETSFLFAVPAFRIRRVLKLRQLGGVITQGSFTPHFSPTDNVTDDIVVVSSAMGGRAAVFFPRSLTGEGHAREKVIAALDSVAPRGNPAEGAGPVSHGHRAIPLAECKNMVFMGTLACGGHAKAVVVATGTYHTPRAVSFDPKIVDYCCC